MLRHRSSNRAAPRPSPRPSRPRERGQALVIFAGAIVLLVGLLAIVIDVTWYWANTLQVQRAADAAALAGAVWLPEQPAKATTVALASARQNGYVPGGQVTVTAVQNPSRDIQLDTMVSAPVPTFFMRLFGISSIQATRTAKAEYVLPVPMGSPLNYFGAFGDLRGWIYTDTSWQAPTAQWSGGGPGSGWANAADAFRDESPNPAAYATVGNTTAMHIFGNFNIPMPASAADARFTTYGGIEVQVRARSSVASGCGIQAEITSNAGAPVPTWIGTAAATNDPAALTNTDQTVTMGDPYSSASNDQTAWWRTTGWTTTNFSNANFAVRLKSTGSGACGTATLSVDWVRVRVTYQEQSPAITGPSHETLKAQGVWAGILSQGADIVNGDIYAPQNNGSGSNTQYNPTAYYDYAIEMQPGTTNGTVYVFDPVFCETNSDFGSGMGDHYYGSSGSAMRTYYELYDTNNTPYTTGDDTLIASSGNLFADGVARTDPSQGGRSAGSGRIDCQRGKITDPSDGGYWHNRWWPIATGLAGPTDATPRIYRIHVSSTGPGQGSVNTLNNFSLFASVAGHTCPSSPVDPACPRVYGYGAMEAFSPLDPSSAADLYLSQIGAVYAGKTIRVSLWDPGDTGNLRADLSFRMPTTTGYVDAPFTWSATKFATNGANCNGSSSGTVTSLRTNNGGSGGGLFNGCWVIINIAIPTGYTAPQPPGEPGKGWWKIRYTMGTGTSQASDLTTWKTQIVGNPVHLVVP